MLCPPFPLRAYCPPANFTVSVHPRQGVLPGQVWAPPLAAINRVYLRVFGSYEGAFVAAIARYDL